MPNSRLAVRKTYKLYINGEFPRTESGRSFPVVNKGGDLLANACRGSRKDLRNAVAAARKAFGGWSGKTAYNRGQILYRMAEVCEARAAELQNELIASGATKAAARNELEAVIDRLVYYAGWSDKYTQLIGTVNPVAGPYYNFSVPEPTGVVGIVAPEEPSLLGLISRMAPAIVSGNTAVIIASESRPLVSITFAEALATSDLPAGVVNILTGFKKELVPWLAAHMDVNLIDGTGLEEGDLGKVIQLAADSVKRFVRFDSKKYGWDDQKYAQSLYSISDFLEIKTVWHPMGM
jgi:acyl-CoA reductase-like NAD-dependent aldehyde dehydrogenase